MPDALDSPYDHSKTEKKIYELWEKSGFFSPDKLPGREKKTYAIHLPPPNITGSLHMGHALNATISDILIRYHRMKGEKTVWFPGIDHAGIATQNVVEKELKKEGKTRWDLGREKFVERVWEWKKEYGTIILDQLKKLGCSLDWSRTRFTMDPEYVKAVKDAFIYYYKKGWIYRGKRVVNWCPRCGTSLSDLEVTYKEEKTRLWHIRYPLKDGGSITVATTRPETMLGDAAVAVHPSDDRHKKLVGKIALLPLQNREIPVIADQKIDKEFGTGAVKVTPAHDIADSEIAERHKLPYFQVIDERGRMTAEAGEKFKNFKVKEAREKIIEELKKLDLIKKTEDYIHNVALCSRCESVLEPLLSNQWFLKMDKLAAAARDAVKSRQTKIIPENFEKGYFSWLENIRDWCISRQIWWGHQLPVWLHEEKCIPRPGHEKDIEKCQPIKVLAEKPSCDYCDAKYVQSEDVLDTWFSSALWPFAALSEEDLKNFYPSSVLITARDIINLWVGRMIFSGLEFKGKAPFPEVLIHATVLTKEGKRMSKSLGTGEDPLNLIEKHGADALRFGLIWQNMGTQDIRWDETAVVAGRKFSNKLWNIARFILAKTEGKKHESDLKEIREESDKEFLRKLDEAKKAVEEGILNYQFGQALHALYDFIWHELADKYIEESKKREDNDVKAALDFALHECLVMLHPFMPFVTESIHLKLNPEELLIVKKW